MLEREFEAKLDPDPALNDFIDTFDLPRGDSEFLKQESLRPPVRQELNSIWHLLEVHGEEARRETQFAIEQLVARLKI